MLMKHDKKLVLSVREITQSQAGESGGFCEVPAPGVRHSLIGPY